LIITFKTKRLEKTFNSRKLLIRKYGDQNAEYIIRRMAVLRASNSLEEVPTEKPIKCHKLKGKREDQFALNLKEPYRLVFEPDYNSIPRKEDGGINLEAIIKIKILSVEDYH